MSAPPNSTLTNLRQTIDGLQRQLAERTSERDEFKSERDEALARETATAEVLGVINASPGHLAPVFEAMLEKALSLCSATLRTLYTFDGEMMHVVAIRGAPADCAERLTAGPIRPGAGVLGRITRG